MNELTLSNNSLITESIAQQWFDFLDVKPKTLETYAKALKQFVLFLNGNDKPQRQDVINFRESIRTTHKPTTCQTYLMAVKQFFKWLSSIGAYPNIAENVKGIKIDKGFKKDYLTSNQAKSVLENIDRTTLSGKRDYAIILLMLTTGLRTVEVQRANIEDLRNVADFTALFIQGKGREDKEEFVKVAPSVEKAINEYLNARGVYRDSEPLFGSVANRNSGERMTTRSISRLVKNSLIDADLNRERLTAHSLRHTTATLNLMNGGTLEETKQLLRHSNINTTLIYAHSLERANNNSENRIESVLFN
ncbi:MAG: tyrosine-type recombinase/integrase [Erysipelotrichaceae bacterium]|nr:tyrosine-type recombinase/integrase [Erysipelotrichaceae bacterium]